MSVPARGAAPALPPGWWKPVYWPVWLLWPALRGISLLPFAVRLWLGVRLGRVLFSLMATRREIARVNLSACFPDLTETRRDALLRHHFEAIGIALMETPSAWWSPPEKLGPLLSITGREHLDSALEKGNGAILMSAHFISMEPGLRHFSLDRYLCAVYRPNNNAVFDYIINQGRAGHQGEMIDRSDIRKIVRTLRANIPVWYPPDQDHGSKHSVFVPFFGIPSATITATTRLAKLSGAPVVPCYFHRLPDAQGYEIVLLPVLENFPGNNEIEDAERLTHILEEQIRRSPEQYLWLHRRFKTRPPLEEEPPVVYPRRVKRRARS